MKLILACCIMFLPLKRLRLTSAYGYRIHPITHQHSFHAGVDLKSSHDTVFAVSCGTVAQVGYDPLLGIHVRIVHDGFQSIYGHLSQVWVIPGQNIAAGEPIAITGATGRVTGEHLHFSIISGDRNTDPLEFLIQNLKKQNHE